MQTSLKTWVRYAHADYLAGRGYGSHTTPVPVLLISAPGDGKSSIVENALLDHMEQNLFPGETPESDPRVDAPAFLAGSHIHYSPNGLVASITDMPSTRDSIDYRGIMVPKKDGTSGYTMSDIVKMERELYARGVKLVILFLDELLQSDHMTQKVLCDGMLNGRYGPYTLRPETWTVAASNRQKDGAGVNRALTILTNRVNIIEVHMPLDDWCVYAAEELKLPPLCISFARAFPGEISVDQPPKEGPFPTKRSFTYAAQWLQSYKTHVLEDSDEMSLPFGRGGGDTDYVFQKVSGFIGEGLTTQLAAYANVVNELPTYEEIMSNPEGARVPERNRMDACYAASQMVIHYADADNMDTLWAYVERLPEELQVATAKQMLARSDSGMLHNSPRLSKWISTHNSLIRASRSV